MSAYDKKANEDMKMRELGEECEEGCCHFAIKVGHTSQVDMPDRYGTFFPVDYAQSCASSVGSLFQTVSNGGAKDNNISKSQMKLHLVEAHHLTKEEVAEKFPMLANLKSEKNYSKE